ncbi:hypothetical protein ACOSQ2_025594 [Xanthoceras sorbifolium]
MARVLLDVSKPLIRGLRVRMNDESICSVVVCYEHLPNFFYYCGKIGHLIREYCSNSKGVMEGPDIKFGVWLKAPVVERAKRCSWKSDRSTNKDSKDAGGEWSFNSDKSIDEVSKEAGRKSEESREMTGLVLGSNPVKKRLVEEPILHLNSFDLLVGKKGGDTVFEPNLLGYVVSVISGAETVIDSNTLGSKVDGLARDVLVYMG